jgi:hypothetical protein
MFNNYIYYSDDPIVTSEFCNKLINKFNNDKHTHAGVCGTNKDGASVNTDIKQSTDLFIYNTTKYHFESQTLEKALMLSLKEYGSLLEQTAPEMVYPMFRRNAYITGFNIQHTKPEEFFTWHSDDYWEPEHTDGYFRAISYLIYLNDVTEGGQTEFIDGQLIQPKQGHICFFPCTWSFVHRGVPPISGDKYLIAGWWMTDSSVGASRRLVSDEYMKNMNETDFRIQSSLMSTKPV